MLLIWIRMSLKESSRKTFFTNKKSTQKNSCKKIRKKSEKKQKKIENLFIQKNLVLVNRYACFMCSTPDDIVLQCLDVLDALLCYTVLPNKMLPEWVNALCRTVNREIYVQKSWDIMKKLLGTKMGHAALLYMCNLLDNSSNVNDDALLRGAVFYINMGLWGSTCSKANDLFKQSPTSVLQSFLFVSFSLSVFFFVAKFKMIR